MPLTVTEKQHWKERITRKIDKKIETIAAADANLLDRVEREARGRALESLGLASLEADFERINQDEETLKKRKERLQRQMLAVVRRVPIEDIDEHWYHGDHHPEVSNAISRRQAVHEEELLGADETGQKILKLRQEKEELLDTVWLASSGKQIKELWQKVALLLGDELTSLQQEALAIEPDES